MRSWKLAAILAGSAAASPRPQGIDWDAVNALTDLPTPSIPLVNAEAAQTTVAFDPTEAAAAVEAAVLANPNDKSLERRQSCTSDSQNPKQWQDAIPDTSAASTPAGYYRTFANLKGSSQGVYGYMGYSVLDRNDEYTQECANRCTKIDGCQSFNTYFERAPSFDPTEACPNPASDTVLKCVYYGGPVSAETATNTGQWRRKFAVVIAGSNGYVNGNIATPDGYSAGVSLRKVTMNVPTKNCAGDPTYLGVKTFQDGPFSAEKCAAACTATSEWNRAHPHVWYNGRPRTCQMFVTYILYNGTTAQGQFCAMYDESWSTAFATEKGQWRDNGKSWFNMDFAYMFSNATSSTIPSKSCDNPENSGASGVCRDAEQYWDTTKKSCVKLPVCDAKTQFLDTTKKTCVDYPVCKADSEFLDQKAGKCISYAVCDADTQYLDKTKNECVTYPTCKADSEFLDKTSAKCITYATCDLDSQYLDKTKNECVTYPTCAADSQYLDKKKNECVTYLTCAQDEVLDKTSNTCDCVGVNLVPNGDFDADTPRWKTTNGSVFYVNAQNSRTFEARLGLATPQASATQAVTGMKLGRPYRLRMSVSILASSTWTYACSLEAKLGSTKLGDASLGPFTAQRPFKNYDMNFVGEGSAADLQLAVSCPGVTSNSLIASINIDNVQLIDTSCAIPSCGSSTYLSGKTCIAYPACNAQTHWLDKPSRSCIAYPICDSVRENLNYNTKLCEAIPIRTCGDVSRILGNLYTSSNGARMSLGCPGTNGRYYGKLSNSFFYELGLTFQQCVDKCAATPDCKYAYYLTVGSLYACHGFKENNGLTCVEGKTPWDWSVVTKL